MKKNYVIKETIYTPAPVEKEVIENVETLAEHVENSVPVEMKIEILVNEDKLNEDCDTMKAVMNRKEFKGLFGPGSKPHKGDVLSIAGARNKYKIKKAKKFTAKKKGGKGYMMNLQKIAA
jgi:hypothetical protein